MEKNRPVHNIPVGLIQAAIWSNTGKHGDFYSVTFERLFKRDQEAPWNSTNSFRKNDLAAIMTAAESAYKWIAAKDPNK